MTNARSARTMKGEEKGARSAREQTLREVIHRRSGLIEQGGLKRLSRKAKGEKLIKSGELKYRAS